ncbi:MAG: hypothetical protein ABIH34_05845, partial [Nanoarchaeota archaeon]
AMIDYAARSYGLNNIRAIIPTGDGDYIVVLNDFGLHPAEGYKTRGNLFSNDNKIPSITPGASLDVADYFRFTGGNFSVSARDSTLESRINGTIVNTDGLSPGGHVLTVKYEKDGRKESEHFSFIIPGVDVSKFLKEISYRSNAYGGASPFNTLEELGDEYICILQDLNKAEGQLSDLLNGLDAANENYDGLQKKLGELNDNYNALLGILGDARGYFEQTNAFGMDIQVSGKGRDISQAGISIDNLLAPLTAPLSDSADSTYVKASLAAPRARLSVDGSYEGGNIFGLLKGQFGAGPVVILTEAGGSAAKDQSTEKKTNTYAENSIEDLEIDISNQGRQYQLGAGIGFELGSLKVNGVKLTYIDISNDPNTETINSTHTLTIGDRVRQTFKELYIQQFLQNEVKRLGLSAEMGPLFTNLEASLQNLSGNETSTHSAIKYENGEQVGRREVMDGDATYGAERLVLDGELGLELGLLSLIAQGYQAKDQKNNATERTNVDRETDQAETSNSYAAHFLREAYALSAIAKLSGTTDAKDGLVAYVSGGRDIPRGNTTLTYDSQEFDFSGHNGDTHWAEGGIYLSSGNLAALVHQSQKRRMQEIADEDILGTNYQGWRSPVDFTLSDDALGIRGGVEEQTSSNYNDSGIVSHKSKRMFADVDLSRVISEAMRGTRFIVGGESYEVTVLGDTEKTEALNAYLEKGVGKGYSLFGNVHAPKDQRPTIRLGLNYRGGQR